MKHKLYKELGFDVLVIPYWETWEEERGEKSKDLDQYIRKGISDLLEKELTQPPVEEMKRLNQDERLQQKEIPEEPSVNLTYGSGGRTHLFVEFEDDSSDDED